MPVRITLIDEDLTTRQDLAALIQTAWPEDSITTATDVVTALDALIAGTDWLFIRISAWDDYQRIVNFLPHRPAIVIFLATRIEKCAYYLSEEVDFHLQPPYRPLSLTRIRTRLADPTFRPRPLNVFFLKSQCRYYAVPYPDLLAVHSQRGWLSIRTTHQTFVIAGCFPAFLARLPLPLTRISRNLTVSDAYLPAVQHLTTRRRRRRKSSSGA